MLEAIERYIKPMLKKGTQGGVEGKDYFQRFPHLQTKARLLVPFLQSFSLSAKRQLPCEIFMHQIFHVHYKRFFFAES